LCLEGPTGLNTHDLTQEYTDSSLWRAGHAQEDGHAPPIECGRGARGWPWVTGGWRHEPWPPFAPVPPLPPPDMGPQGVWGYLASVLVHYPVGRAWYLHERRHLKNGTYSENGAKVPGSGAVAFDLQYVPMHRKRSSPGASGSIVQPFVTSSRCGLPGEE
jgi:hypothetical protein